jgi:hypothetical protein
MPRNHIAFLLVAAVFVQSCRSAEFSSGPTDGTRRGAGQNGPGSGNPDDKSRLFSQDEAKGSFAPPGGKSTSGGPGQGGKPGDSPSGVVLAGDKGGPGQNGDHPGVGQNRDDHDDNKDRDRDDKNKSDKKPKSRDSDKKDSGRHHSGNSNQWIWIVAGALGAIAIGAIIINSRGECQAADTPQDPSQIDGYRGIHISPEELVDRAYNQGPGARFCDGWITKRISEQSIVRDGVNNDLVDPRRVNCGYAADVGNHAKQLCGR